MTAKMTVLATKWQHVKGIESQTIMPIQVIAAMPANY